MKLFSFPHISAPDATVLILGTMPGRQSLEKNQYYGHPQNSFWKILFTLFNTPFSQDYEERKQLLIDNRIALWDVLQACEREGSLDSAIKKELPNDFEAFLKFHPQITHIFFNGQKASAFFKKYVVASQGFELLVLPSTSPANAGKNFETKLKEWQIIKKALS